VAVRIRLQRKGAKHTAFFRIVTADSRSPRDGRFIEQLGYYDPLKDPAEIKVDTAKVIDWFGKGAQPSETVKSLFSRIGIMQTWHEVRKGRPLEEILHIEEDARKRIEAQAAMKTRAKAEAPTTKAAAAKVVEEQVESPASKPAPAEVRPEGAGADEMPAESQPEGAAVGEAPAEEKVVEAVVEAPAEEKAVEAVVEAPAEEKVVEAVVEASAEGDTGAEGTKE
jgi:small subunit ribosomal protein S16